MLAVHRAERVLDVEVRERRGPVGGLPAHLVLVARLRRLEVTGLRQRDLAVSERPDHRVGVVADDVARSGTGAPSSSARRAATGPARRPGRAHPSGRAGALRRRPARRARQVLQQQERCADTSLVGDPRPVQLDVVAAAGQDLLAP